MLGRRFCILNAKSQRFTNSIKYSFYIAHGKSSLPLNQFSTEVIERHHTTTSSASDLPQRTLDRLSVQVHRHAFPHEECRFSHIKTCAHQFLKPVLRQE